MLYLIPTPLGNLSDITLRALEVMKSVDYLLCEDTRRSSILLNHYEIHKPLKSYHQFNESQKLDDVIEDLSQGKNIGLLSDGGTPAICDPGAILIRRCIDENIPFTALPGPCAIITGLLLSGFATQPFQFLGFMPKKEGEIRSIFPFVLSYPGTSIFYETPQRIADTLELLCEIAPETSVAMARELTKTFEETVRRSAKDLLDHVKSHPPRGEIVLLIEGFAEDTFSSSPKELVEQLQEMYQLPLTDAIKTAAHLLKIPKQSIYKLFHHTDSDRT